MTAGMRQTRAYIRSFFTARVKDALISHVRCLLVGSKNGFEREITTELK